MRERSARLNLAWEADAFTVEKLVEWLRRQEACECCGRTFRLRPEGKAKSDSSPTIDRLVPALGYVTGNVALLCWRCNNLKRDASADELETVVRWLRRRGL